MKKEDQQNIVRNIDPNAVKEMANGFGSLFNAGAGKNPDPVAVSFAENMDRINNLKNSFAEGAAKDHYVSNPPGKVALSPTQDVDNRILSAPDIDAETLFRVPDWGYQDFIRERTLWQKGLDSATGEPGWFYFKIFFRFDTHTGLLGGLLNEERFFGGIYQQTNISYDSAVRYLTINASHYSKLDMEGRINTLRKFGSALSFINGHAPWFFNSIEGLDKAASTEMTQPMKDRTITIGLRQDAVDMRLSTLVDLYKYACFDYVNMKEVVPQNLRQFDMTVVLFHTPLRWYHTGMQTMKRGTFSYKSLSDDDMSNRMSYKMFTFKGCEFDLNSLGSVYSSEMKNESAFGLAGNKININYKRVYQHTFNEWGQFMIGDDGVYYDGIVTKKLATIKKPENAHDTEEGDDNKVTVGMNTQQLRMAAIEDVRAYPYYYNPGAQIFKPLVDATEARINWMMRQIQPKAILGNIYVNDCSPESDYYKMKLTKLKNSSIPDIENALTTDQKMDLIRQKVKKFKGGSKLSDLSDRVNNPNNVKSDYFNEKLDRFKGSRDRGTMSEYVRSFQTEDSQ